MPRKRSTSITFRCDPQILYNFQMKVIEKHGRIYGHMANEFEKALILRQKEIEAELMRSPTPTGGLDRC